MLRAGQHKVLRSLADDKKSQPFAFLSAGEDPSGWSGELAGELCRERVRACESKP
jgi:hypothetical protein